MLGDFLRRIIRDANNLDSSAASSNQVDRVESRTVSANRSASNQAPDQIGINMRPDVKNEIGMSQSLAIAIPPL